jgi:hypothetical protein
LVVRSCVFGLSVARSVVRLVEPLARAVFNIFAAAAFRTEPVGIYICMYVFVCVRKYANIYIYIFIYLFIYIILNVYIYVCVCIFWCIYTYVYMSINTYIYSDGPKLRISRLFPNIFDPELRIWSQWRVRMYS